VSHNSTSNLNPVCGQHMTLVSEVGRPDSGMLGVDCWIQFEAKTNITPEHGWAGTVTHFTDYCLLVRDTSHSTIHVLISS
jgi:hypothetical protein